SRSPRITCTCATRRGWHSARASSQAEVVVFSTHRIVPCLVWLVAACIGCGGPGDIESPIEEQGDTGGDVETEPETTRVDVDIHTVFEGAVRTDSLVVAGNAT